MAALGDELYLGEDISCLVTATDPTNGDAPLTDLGCEIEFYAPPKNPKTTVADRTSDDSVTLTYDASRGGYYGTVPTASWNKAGTWWYRVFLTGSRSNWAYGKFKIKA